jgi:SAM-dependent methyltransferase
MTKRYLNLGCGYRFHPDWENLDLVATDPGVRAFDLRKGVPYPDATFDVVYNSHLLEHFAKQAALAILRECLRVLRPSGVIRIAVPDLECIARLYLEALEKASRGEPGWSENYDWMILEMYDQAVRERPGGSASEFFRREIIPNWDFVRERWGVEARNAVEGFQRTLQASKEMPASVRSRLKYAFENPRQFAYQKLVRLLLNDDDYRAIQIGRFRCQGEVHHWMYDAYSLGRLLQSAGFHDPQRQQAAESRVPRWAEFHLDTEKNGSIYKPDSLYMEATKP